MLTVIGEALVDLVDSGDHASYTAHPGGGPLNVAVGAARLGLPTALLARIATDGFGPIVRRHATDNGVDVSACPPATEQATLAVVSLDEQRRAAYSFYLTGTADWQWTEAELRDLPPGTTFLHTGSLASWTAPGDARVADLAARARAAGVVVSYDPNVRPLLLRDPARTRPLVERNVALSHVVKASDDDLRWLYPDTEVAEVAADWLRLGPALVLVTSGPDGVIAYRPDAPPLARPGRSVAVVDTVGAGDAFTAGFLTVLARRGDTPASLSTLDDAALTTALDHGVLVATLTCGRAGADPPTAAEVAAASGQPREPTGLGQ